MANLARWYDTVTYIGNLRPELRLLPTTFNFMTYIATIFNIFNFFNDSHKHFESQLIDINT